MVNSEDKLSALFRSLGPDDENFRLTENEMTKNSEQRWPLFKSVSLARLEATPELSVQERQLWGRQEKPVVEVRKPVLSMPPFNEKLSISLDKIIKRVELGTEQPTVHSAQSSVQGGSMADRYDKLQELATNNINLPDNTQKFSTPTPMTSTSEFLKQPVADLNLEVEPRSYEHATVLPDVAVRDLADMDRTDDSLQSLFSRIQGVEKVAVKPAEKRSSFFDRLRKR